MPSQNNCDRCGTAIDGMRSATVAYQHPVETESTVSVAERETKHLCGDCRERLHVFVSDNAERRDLRYIE